MTDNTMVGLEADSKQGVHHYFQMQAAHMKSKPRVSDIYKCRIGQPLRALIHSPALANLFNKYVDTCASKLRPEQRGMLTAFGVVRGHLARSNFEMGANLFLDKRVNCNISRDGKSR